MIFSKLLLGVAALAATALALPVVVVSPPPPKSTTNTLLQNEASINLHALIPNLATHADGMVDISADGVLRSLHPNGTILDYVKLSPQHLQSLIKQHRWAANLTEICAMINGYDGSDGQAQARKLPVSVVDGGKAGEERSVTDGKKRSLIETPMTSLTNPTQQDDGQSLNERSPSHPSQPKPILEPIYPGTGPIPPAFPGAFTSCGVLICHSNYDCTVQSGGRCTICARFPGNRSGNDRWHCT